MDSTQKIGKDNKSNNQLDSTQKTGKDDKTEAYKIKNCKLNNGTHDKDTMDSDNEEEALDTVMDSDGDTAISCKECGKRYWGPGKVFLIMHHLIQCGANEKERKKIIDDIVNENLRELCHSLA